MKQFFGRACSAALLVSVAVSAHAATLQDWRLTDIYGTTIDFQFDIDTQASPTATFGGVVFDYGSSNYFMQSIKSVTFNGVTFLPLDPLVADGVPGVSYAEISVGVPSGTYSSQLESISLFVSPHSTTLTSPSFTSLPALLQYISVEVASGEAFTGLTYLDKSNPFVVNAFTTEKTIAASFTNAAVPEPSTLALMAIGMFGISMLASRRRTS